MSAITHCKRCRRLLTQRTSVSRGYGPTCYAKIMGYRVRDSREHDISVPEVQSQFKPTGTLLEAYGESVKDVLERKEKGTLKDVPELIPFVKDREQLHKDAKKSRRKQESKT